MSTKEGKGGTGKASVKKAVSSSTKAGLQDLKVLTITLLYICILITHRLFD
jgi:hypothetical protein